MGKGINVFREKGPGVLLCMAIAAPAWLLGKAVPVIGGPVFSIFIGMIITLIWKKQDRFRAGTAFTSKKVLQLAVILLGFGLNFMDILIKGKESLPIILVTIGTALIVAFLLHKALRMGKNISVLIGVGSSICGGSAIAATAPVIGARDEEIAQSISVIFLFNVIAAVIFPMLGGVLGLSDDGFALFAGTAVNDTSSVTAAAAAWDGLHGSYTLGEAAIVKLVRTLAIIPITLVLAIYTSRRNKAAGRQFSMGKIFPYFILFFLLAAAVTTAFDLPSSVTGPIKEVSKFCIIMAMAAIGLGTNIVKLVKSGGKPIFMGLCCWICIAAMSLWMQHILGIW